jgi:hypothetical protein
MFTPNDHERPVLVAIMLCALGIMWSYWLYLLLPKALAPTATASRTQKCHQVAPALRSTLLVFSVFMACSALYFIVGTLLVADETTPPGQLCKKCLPMLVLFLVFLSQILFVVRIRHNTDTVHENCTRHVRLQWYLHLLFAFVQIGVGGYLLL